MQDVDKCTNFSVRSKVRRRSFEGRDENNCGLVETSRVINGFRFRERIGGRRRERFSKKLVMTNLKSETEEKTSKRDYAFADEKVAELMNDSLKMY